MIVVVTAIMRMAVLMYMVCVVRVVVFMSVFSVMRVAVLMYMVCIVHVAVSMSVFSVMCVDKLFCAHCDVLSFSAGLLTPGTCLLSLTV